MESDNLSAAKGPLPSWTAADPLTVGRWCNCPVATGGLVIHSLRVVLDPPMWSEDGEGPAEAWCVHSAPLEEARAALEGLPR